MTTVKQDATRAAILGALRDLIDGEYTAARGDTLASLVEVHDEYGAKTIDVTLPDGTKVATVTLVEPSGTVTVTDRAAFTAWVQKQAPEQVTEEPSPLHRAAEALKAADDSIAQIYNDNQGEGPGPDEIRGITAQHVLAALGIDPEPAPPKVNTKFEKDLLGTVLPGENGDAFNPTTGERVPGVQATEPGPPIQFQLRYQPDGRTAIAAAWRAGRLDGAAHIPQLETGDLA